ncbi:nuclear transport factor 2 family protein [Cytobacillus purgationiresistens]|uniref:DUF4440 domain-containing protein n=1 Tax=Cytobacillus purgationiresistens TaxID=863449 RepID=A0ABU0AJD1_9BACI|nr:nuclear transport factor 2 family protein [Cytobacillus purgationiresistens]MDQ0271373.1 hypothetical protein [Cytobacillus purgationiresistens]
MDIQAALDRYFQAWNEAFTTKDGEKIRGLMSEDFKGYWAHSGMKEPDVYDYYYDLNSVLKQYKQAEKSFEVLSYSERRGSEDYVVLGTETNLVDGEPFPAKCMFIFTKEDNDWKLFREYIELER